MPQKPNSEWTIRLIKSPEEMASVEELQRIVWPGTETDVIPAHMLLAVVHNGGLLLGAYVKEEIIGTVFGFPGYYETPDGPRLKHHSHILAVHPNWRGYGVGFALKRAQWQLVRHQGIDRITWTYDPLLSRNAYLNIARLGTVCNTYLHSEYGEMRDGLNAGLPSDRFQVDWWVFTKRVEKRLNRRAPLKVALEDYRNADALFLEAYGDQYSLRPPEGVPPMTGSLVLVEIPEDFLKLKDTNLPLARDWRFYGREIFEIAFKAGYLVTDFLYENGRSFYILTQGNSTL
jgi:predicted GNAT superfamily acetyltransferase